MDSLVPVKEEKTYILKLYKMSTGFTLEDDELLYKNFDTQKSLERIQAYAKKKGFDFTIEEIKELDDTPEDFSEKQTAFGKAEKNERRSKHTRSRFKKS